MANDNIDGSGKKIIIALAAGAILVCLLAAAALVIWSYGGTSAQPDVLKLRFADNGNVSDDQLTQTKSVVEGRFKTLDSGARAETMRDEQGNAFVLVHYGNIAYDDAASIATVPGVFEIRIQTQDNQSEHVLYGDDVKTASDPVQSASPGGPVTWDTTVELTESGAQKFRQACIDTGATNDTASHPVMMSLDNKTFRSAPLSPGLADTIDHKPADVLLITTGTGDQGKAKAEQLIAFLRGGMLPARLEIVSPA